MAADLGPGLAAERRAVILLVDLYELRDRAAGLGMEATRRELCLLIEELSKGRSPT